MKHSRNKPYPLQMKPYDQLTSRQKFFRLNIIRFVIYGGFVLTLYMGMSKIAEFQGEKREQYNRIEDTMMN